MRKVIPLLIALFAATASANPFGVQTVLIPLPLGVTAGAFGTNWTTTLWVHNASDVLASIDCVGKGTTDPGVCQGVAAHTTAVITPPYYTTNGPFFLRIPTGIVSLGPPIGTVTAEMQTSAGKNTPTAIPLARPSDFHDGTTFLNAVPVNSHTRLRLRVYGLNNGSATIHGFGLKTGLELVTMALPLVGLDATLPNTRIPAYAEAAITQPASVDDTMRLEITSSVQIWAFVSVTDNDTQQFTVVSPHPMEYVPISVAKE